MDHHFDKLQSILTNSIC